jgi:hypothetical protein
MNNKKRAIRIRGTEQQIAEIMQFIDTQLQTPGRVEVEDVGYDQYRYETLGRLREWEVLNNPPLIN